MAVFQKIEELENQYKQAAGNKSLNTLTGIYEKLKQLLPDAKKESEKCSDQINKLIQKCEDSIDELTYPSDTVISD